MSEDAQRRRSFPEAFKLETVAAIRGGRSVSQVAAELGLPDRLVRSWLRWAEGRRGGRQRDSAKSIVVGAVEVRGGGSGRIRLAVVNDLAATSLAAFVTASVAPGSIVLTDGWQGYAPLRHAYDHRPSTAGDPKNAAKLLPRVHRTFSNLKTWLRGTHHGVGAKHLPHYIDEFVFRFNRRRTPMAAFQTLLGLATQHAPTSYKMLYAAEPTG